MLIKRETRVIQNGDDIAASAITPRDVFENRRRMLRAAGVAGLAATGGALGLGFGRGAWANYVSPDPHAGKLAAASNAKFVVAEKVTPYRDVTTYNNFYEFGTDKRDPSQNAGTLRSHPWGV